VDGSGAATEGGFDPVICLRVWQARGVVS